MRNYIKLCILRNYLVLTYEKEKVVKVDKEVKSLRCLNEKVFVKEK